MAVGGPSSAHLLFLPPEILEEILILTTIFGFPTAVSVASQTCRALHDLVYHQFHKHLWREIFIRVFDDPRPARDVARHGADTSAGIGTSHFDKGKGNASTSQLDEFPWEEEYKARIWTARFIHHLTDTASHILRPPTAGELHKVVKTLLHIVSTLAPLPSASLTGISPSSHPHPVFPPLSVATHTQPKLISKSKNIIWLADVLSSGLPEALKNRLSAVEDGRVEIVKVPEVYDGLLAKLIAQTGLMEHGRGSYRSSGSHLQDAASAGFAEHGGAILQTANEFEASDEAVAGSSSASADSPVSLQASDDDNDSHAVPGELEPNIIVGKLPEQSGIRRLARMRVYNMSYLHRDRQFGPFLPIPPLPSAPADSRSPSLASPYFSDEAPTPPAIPEANIFLSTLEDGEGPEDPFDADYDDDDEHEVAIPHTFHSQLRDSALADVPASALRFDWAWISAARQVIELNLRDLLAERHHNMMRALMTLESLRACSAPALLEENLTGSDDAESLRPQVGEDGQFAEGEGWDWAGAEGQWRRCVCWLDYRDLIANNVRELHTRFNDQSLCEVMRIIPFTLRVASYSSAPPEWPGRPKIHVEGEISGSGSHTRRVRGTVEMVGGGDVRWSMITLREDGDGEWQSEGVQLGGLRSATGVIGLWTGAEHEQMDPLGAFWSWKVGPIGDRTREAQTVQAALEEISRLAAANL
ncbi:hypothetical protein FA95DRAFT_1553055 [Auriscalpium vulgare]|uniref:Uncharacterized protein n=1 Tax=Auriscalpium vulgare TaxID=40419 RepID=A0ACB8S8H5_9AGAM|nr:hypothetical protein FA95DRAFT_1553055 [Auriscalpium vulgare]